MPTPRPRSDPAPRLIGSIAALIALAASILVQVDPVQSLIRAAISYLAANVSAQVWLAFVRPDTADAPVAQPTGPAEAADPSHEKRAA